LATEPETVTPSQIWRDMTPEQRTRAAELFWGDGESMAQQVEAIQAIARQMRFRPQSVLGLAPDKRIRHLASMTRLSEPVASRLLVVYHLNDQRAMLEAFLDRLGIPHEHGLIAEEEHETPTPARLQEAAEALRAAFPVADVRVYLRTLAAQDPDTWGSVLPVVSAWPSA
jgi:hypothetical protein